MTVKCPVCEKHQLWEGNPYRPFCSKRCQLIDLDGWLGERYRVPVDEWPEELPSEGNTEHPES